MITPELIVEGKSLAFKIAPELSAWPLYILPELPVGMAPWGEAWAWTTPGGPLDFNLRGYLQDRGEWQGPGTTIVFGPTFGQRTVADPTSLFNLRRRFLQVVVHEIAHNLPAKAPALEWDPPTPALAAWQLERHNVEAAKSQYSDPDWRPWGLDHGIRFIRVCLHLHFRAAMAGCLLPMRGLCAGFDYQLSHPDLYLEAMGDEPERMQAATFAEIEAQPVRAAAAALFAEDVRFWENQPSQTGRKNDYPTHAIRAAMGG